jgi:UDP-N-acetylglucosamine--N-acetylmuramyl-(pentapeptide) pyrophosphoryl-undecaprenol N-acetylglucosamine transferase
MHFLFGAGGTGGHLYPALAVADALRRINKNCRITFAGRSDKIEGQKVPMFGYDFLPLHIDGFLLKPSLTAIKSAIRLLKARNKIIDFMKKETCDAVIVAGAYISIPPGFAAASLKTPLFLMESNVNPGKAITLLSARSKAIFTSFDDSQNHFPLKFRNKIHFTGNPIRADFENLPSSAEAKQIIGFESDKPLLLIFGGSLGAASINNFVASNVNQLADLEFNIVWQTGSNFEIPSNLPKNIKAFNFIDKMSLYYSAADLVVSRSGASTVSELTLTGKPSILIPLPSASNNEQYKNAEVMQNLDAAMLINDKNLNAKLINIVNTLIYDKAKLRTMSENAKRLAKPNAADNIAKTIYNMVVVSE